MSSNYRPSGQSWPRDSPWSGWSGPQPRSTPSEQITAATELTNLVHRFELFDLRLMSPLNDIRGIPTEGENLIIVADVNHVLQFRLFDADGKMVVDTDQKRLAEQARQIEDLRKQLESLWPPHELTRSDKDRVITAVRSIVGHTRFEPGRGQKRIGAFIRSAIRGLAKFRWLAPIGSAFAERFVASALAQITHYLDEEALRPRSIGSSSTSSDPRPKCSSVTISARLSPSRSPTGSTDHFPCSSRSARH